MHTEGRTNVSDPQVSWWQVPYKALMRLVFGDVEFAEREEYQEFRYKLLMVLMVTGALVTGLFLIETQSQVNPIHPTHQRSMLLFTIGTTLLWLLLRGRPGRFMVVAWLYELLSLCESTSSLLFVSADELRLLWFFTNVPGVFILMGKRIGWIITLATMVGLAMVNPHLERPYSPNAMATALFCLFYLGIFFHTYVGRTFSYFSRMRDYNARLQVMADHDPLTQLMNAGAYYAACDKLIALSRRNQSPYAVLFVDLDHFKAINDTHGHAVGDEVLRKVADTLRQSLRQTDLIGRIGGEEFSVFVPDTDLQGAMQVAEGLRRAIEECRPRAGALSLKVTASIGVASHATGVQSMQAIQQRADQAMYEAKRAGRNRVSGLEMQPA
jgi:diguanylate cyclase (GGDEF)-like protein